MKKVSKFLTVVAVASFFAVAGVQAQDIVVSARLHSSGHFVRPPRPSRHHIWVSEEWTPSGGTYVHRDGYWAERTSEHAAWYPGHWRRTPSGNGYIWMPGHWGRA